MRKKWNGSLIDDAEVVWTYRDDLFKQLEEYPQIKTIILSWSYEPHENRSQWTSLNDTSNVIIKVRYFPFIHCCVREMLQV